MGQTLSGYFSGLFACVIFDFLHLDTVSLYIKRTGFQFPEMLLPTPPPPAPEQESQTSVTTREPICCFEDVTQSFNFLPHSAAMPLF